MTEDRAHRQADVHRMNGKWMARAHYGLGIPSVIFATAAATSALADYAFVAGILAGVAAILTAINTFLGDSQGRARAERALTTQLEAIQDEAYAMREMDVYDKPIEPLEKHAWRVERKLNNLCIQAYLDTGRDAPPVGKRTGAA